MKINTKKFIILIAFLIWCGPSLSFAAEISFETQKNNFAPNDEFLVEIYLDGNDELINAIEGSVRFSSEIFELKEIRDGNSTINFWVEKPNKTTSDMISFSGITAGGFYGKHSLIFSMIFQAKKIGNGSISFENLQVLQNDGIGTSVVVNSKSLLISVSDENIGTKSNFIKVQDIDAPEIFLPFIGKDQSIYDGKYFLVFSTQDKASGMDHYEVKEGYFGEYSIVYSPYLLANQRLDKKIYVKAVDKNDNEVVVSVKAQNYTWYQYLIIIAIIILLVVLIYKKVWLNFTKN